MPLWEVPPQAPLQAPFRYWKSAYKVSLEPSPSWATPTAQPVSVGEVLQRCDHLYGLLWTSSNRSISFLHIMNNFRSPKLYMCKMYVCNLKDDSIFPFILVSLKKTYLYHMLVYSQSCGKLRWVSLVWSVIYKGLFTWRGTWHRNRVRQDSVTKAGLSWHSKERENW